MTVGVSQDHWSATALQPLTGGEKHWSSCYNAMCCWGTIPSSRACLQTAMFMHVYARKHIFKLRQNNHLIDIKMIKQLSTNCENGKLNIEKLFVSCIIAVYSMPELFSLPLSCCISFSNSYEHTAQRASWVLSARTHWIKSTLSASVQFFATVTHSKKWKQCHTTFKHQWHIPTLMLETVKSERQPQKMPNFTLMSC